MATTTTHTLAQALVADLLRGRGWLRLDRTGLCYLVERPDHIVDVHDIDPDWLHALDPDWLQVGPPDRGAAARKAGRWMRIYGLAPSAAWEAHDRPDWSPEQLPPRLARAWSTTTPTPEA